MSVKFIKAVEKKKCTYMCPKKVALQRCQKPYLPALSQLELVMCLPLTASRKLARVDASKVINALNEQGYFLQMPPSEFVKVEAEQWPALPRVGKC